MGIAIFFVMTVMVAAVIVYPLFAHRAQAEPAPSVTDGDVERALVRLRAARRQGGTICPSCGATYRAGDRFCVRCGGALMQTRAAADGPVCPSCGATVRMGDRFCSECGHNMAAEEVT
jgi:predicted amidophosphoribosyltransferase